MLKLTQLDRQAEIFYSIQGEGISQGLPSVFVRLAGCNLACSWCDTAYSWNGEIPPLALAAEEAAKLILRHPCRRLVITGGEPLVQQKKLPSLLALLPDHTVEIETNGTIVPNETLINRVEQFNISPKLPHAGNDAARAWRPGVLRLLAGTGKAWFKFVASCEQDVLELLRLSKEAALPRERIMLMPLASDRATLNAMRPQVAGWCLRHGLRYCDRLHIAVWNQKKGV